MISISPHEKMKSLSMSELFQILEVNPTLGLSSDQIISRTNQFGFNEIPEKKRNPFFLFLKKFWGPSAWMIEAIAILSLYLNKRSDFYVSAGLLFINAVIGFLHERRAQQVVKMLQSKLQIQTRALRDGHWFDCPARELVPGDIVRLRMGDFVPADLRIISGDVNIDQSTVTGESAEKSRTTGDEVYSGSIVRQGEKDEILYRASMFALTYRIVTSSREMLTVGCCFL